MPIYSFGKHGLWPGVDYGGLDNLNLLWWDPNATGEDETGTVGKGSYRYVDNGRRFLPGHYPTEPIKFFDPANTITRLRHGAGRAQAQDVSDAEALKRSCMVACLSVGTGQPSPRLTTVAYRRAPRAGTPATTQLSGTSSATTAPAATTTCAPTRTPGSTTQP